ncbi:S1 family peptidase [Erwinia persicina]|uniref:Trypsin-like peptidase domain-containing protein n=1 Tax=Erwinia persicina TaxID=55211 RepID=A0A4U3FIW3_9GAMM|nr:serine protease [Erwinia persicina]MBD8108612.1 trypsin-like peptidase domain-containing protein [Erwinia persicina]MBD8211760.1 trypsin-like peptidase domain-containing protein [Erwinia persicina]TKJ93052.1 hypothetical protein EpCFBP13511_05075 [Erwinia persicina]
MNNTKISLFPLNLSLLKNEIRIGSGTGFLYEYGEKVFLITNYHVLTCREPKNPECLLPGYMDSPDSIHCAIPQFNEESHYIAGELSLKIDDSFTFYEHKKRSNGVDIVAIKIEMDDEQRSIITTQHDIDLVDDIAVHVTSNLFIAGYPWGFSAEPSLPIWKKGTVASDPRFSSEGIPKIYIDTFTNPGMSGSPVFASEGREGFIYNPKYEEVYKKSLVGDIKSKKIISRLDINNVVQTRKFRLFRLMGIYSGRVMFSEKDPQIGIFWPLTLLDELLSDAIEATNPYPPIKIQK